MDTNKRIRIFAFICLFAFISLHSFKFACNAYAQSLSLSIWPPLLEVQIQPGRMVTQAYQLTNNSDHELQVTPLVAPFSPSGENGRITINSFEKVNQFFTFASGEKFGVPFSLVVGQTKEVVLKITIPDNAPEKDFYYTLLFSTRTEPLAAGSSSSSITQIGTNILLTVSRLEQLPVLGRLKEFSGPRIVDSFSAVSLNLRLENFGKNFWKPFGKISIKGILGQKEEVPLDEQNVLANSVRTLVISSFKPKLPLGPFKISLAFSLNENGPELKEEMAFWYLPWKAMAVAVVAGVVIMVIKKLRG